MTTTKRPSDAHLSRGSASTWAVLCFALMVNGCGLVFQGTRQNLALITEPAGADAVFRRTKAVTPATASVSRRSLGYFVYRASKDGYHPACKVIECGTPRWVKVLDSIPAAIPLLVDLAFGALSNCEPTSLSLDSVRPGDVAFGLPTDEDIVRARGQNFDLCQHPYLYDPAFATDASRILVTAGGLQRGYEELGAVDFGRMGGDWISWVTIPIGTQFTYTHISRSFSQATPGEVNELLRRRALRLYGNRVDAVINVAYQANPRHDVYATGLAVHFVAPKRSGSTSAEWRLEELKRLLEKGLITEHEYQERRAVILRDL